MAFMAPVGIGASAVSGGLNAFGALSKGSAEAGQMGYLAAMARVNSEIAKQNASYERSTGEVKAGQYGLKAMFQQGQIQTNQAASGLDVNKGSATDVQRSQRTVAATDMATIRSNAARLAYNYDVQASQQLQQATVYDAGAAQAKKSSLINAFGSLLGGATSVSTKWTQGKALGMWGGDEDEFLTLMQG